MFSGIIEEKARIRKISKTSQGCKLTVESGVVSKDARIGDSISVNGICLTVVEVKGKRVSFDVMEETLRRTNLSKNFVGGVVNLERSLKIGDRISGHFVTGHVDCIGKICTIKKRANDYAMEIEFPVEKKVYLHEKGSIALDGVSLTIAEVRDNRLKIYLIPLTREVTNLGLRKRSDIVNMEFDILSKYSLETELSKRSKSRINISFLKEHGFL